MQADHHHTCVALRKPQGVISIKEIAQAASRQCGVDQVNSKPWHVPHMPGGPPCNRPNPPNPLDTTVPSPQQTPYKPVALGGLWERITITDEDIAKVRREMWGD